MRTTLDIDDDVLAALKERAGGLGITAGRLASDLLRHALSGQSDGQTATGFSEEKAKFEPVSIGEHWVVLKSRGGLVTTDLVRSLEDTIDAEDLKFASAPRRQHPDRTDR